MGIDLGSRKLSWSIFVDNDLVEVNHIEVPASNRASEIEACIVPIRDHLLLADEICIEEPLAGRSVRASLLLAQTCGGVLGEIGRTTSIAPILVSTTAWKKAIVGNGSAKKEQISAWLEQQYEDWFTGHCLYERPKAGTTIQQDRVDAICIGLYSQEISSRSSAFAQGDVV